MSLFSMTLTKKIFEKSLRIRGVVVSTPILKFHLHHSGLDEVTFRLAGPSDRSVLTKCPAILRQYSTADWKFNLAMSFKKYAKKVLLIESTKATRLGYKWYATLEGVDFEEFMKLLEMPDTFMSWFKIVELHVWMLQLKLFQDGPEIRKIRLAVIEAMWDDAGKRAKKLAPLNKNYKQNFRDLYEEFLTIMLSYDEAFLSGDRALYNVLWYYFFDEDCEDPTKVEALISFIRYQVNHLQLINTRDSSEDDISKSIWTSLQPHFSSSNRMKM